MRENTRSEFGERGLGEAGGPPSPLSRLRVGSQGGMPTRSPPEAGLAGDEPWKKVPAFVWPILLHTLIYVNRDPRAKITAPGGKFWLAGQIRPTGGDRAR
jgi:hypothetical protein